MAMNSNHARLCPSPEWAEHIQSEILPEVTRGIDLLPGNDLHHFHVDDTYNPLEPAALLTRLQTIGFAKVAITVDWSVKFVATKPAPPDAS